jgi:hypothetical protein
VASSPRRGRRPDTPVEHPPALASLDECTGAWTWKAARLPGTTPTIARSGVDGGSPRRPGHRRAEPLGRCARLAKRSGDSVWLPYCPEDRCSPAHRARRRRSSTIRSPLSPGTPGDKRTAAVSDRWRPARQPPERLGAGTPSLPTSEPRRTGERGRARGTAPTVDRAAQPPCPRPCPRPLPLPLPWPFGSPPPPSSLSSPPASSPIPES